MEAEASNQLRAGNPSHEQLAASCPSGLGRGYCHFAQFPFRISSCSPVPRRVPAYLPLFIVLCVSATTIRRRKVDSVASNSREYLEAWSMRRLEGVLSHFDLPVLLARNFPRRDAMNVLLEVDVASIIVAHSMCGTLFGVQQEAVGVNSNTEDTAFCLSLPNAILLANKRPVRQTRLRGKSGCHRHREFFLVYTL